MGQKEEKVERLKEGETKKEDSRRRRRLKVDKVGHLEGKSGTSKVK